MFYYVTYWDLLLAPIYIFIFYRLALLIAKKYYKDNPFLKKKLIQGFWAKIIAGILYVLLIQFYYGGGDSFNYFGFGRVMHRGIVSDIKNINFLFSDLKPFASYIENLQFEEFETLTGYMAAFGNQIIARFCCFFGFLCFQNYTVVSLCFVMLSYIGIWRMFIIFYKLFKDYKKEVAVSFLFLPSYLMWGSGILKESICLFCIGIIINIIFNFVYLKKLSFTKIIWVLVLSYIIILIKNYIFYAFALAVVIMFIVIFLKKLSIFSRVLVGLVLMITLAVSAPAIINAVVVDAAKTTSTEQLLERTKQMKNNFESAGGSFVDMGDFEPTILGVSKKIPAAFANVFLRPYLWEARNIVLFVTMLESLFFLILIIRFVLKNKIIFFLNPIFSNPIFTFCFIYAITLGIIIGLTTFNFGAIVRFKVPCMPFFTLLLLLLNKKPIKEGVQAV